MSRLSNKQLRLHVAAAGVAATLSSRWPRPRPLARAERRVGVAAGAVVDVATDAVVGAADAEWAEAVDGALAELAAAAPIRGARLDVELADALVHFDIARGDFADHGERQLATVAAACVRELLGDAADEQELRWQLQADEKHLLVCAVPRGLLRTLRDCASRHGLQLLRIEPVFPARWNRCGRDLSRGLCVLACGDGEHNVIAFIRDGVVEVLSSASSPDLLEDPDAAAPGVDRLLNNLGLERAATPTRLDAQVDRMLASLGVDVAQLRQFVAVEGERDVQALSSRWMVLDEAGAAA